ncbi:LCP family protein [Patescibacteria group bacterium]
MEQNSNNPICQIKLLRILTFSLMISLLIGSVGFGLSVRTTYENLNLKDEQISVLTNEIGDIKQENVYLNNSLEANREIVQEGFDILHNSIKAYVNNDKEEATTEFNNAKNDLITVISDKEYEIKSLQSKNVKLSKELEFQDYNEDIENILILGLHDSLSDTLLLVSINPTNESITLLSIPRDLFVNGRKINSYYGSFGLNKTIDEVYKITGVYADKYVVLDFDAFSKMIDILGGIDIEIKKDIYDPSFPTESNGYTIYEISKGKHHLNGAEALMYARSRKSTSDFDRSERQQQIVQAIRIKLKRLDLLNDLEKAIEIFNEITSTVQTNIDAFEALYYFNHFQNYAFESGNVLSTNNLLYSSKTIDGQYILLPKNGDYYQIKEKISELIKN